MKIGIVGTRDRVQVWEQHLISHRVINEVVITSNVMDLGDVTACLILDDSAGQLDHVLQAIRHGYHVFLISQLPIYKDQAELIYHAAEEANTKLQFAHWPSLAPATQWMQTQIRKPNNIQIIKEMSQNQFHELNSTFESLWIDELAFCIKWMNGTVHHVEARHITLNRDEPIGIHLLLRFDSGATAMIYTNTTSTTQTHKRIGADQTFIMDCNVHAQTVRKGRTNDQGNLYFERRQFDPSRSAQLAAMQFLKSIQLNKATAFNGYDLYQTCLVYEQVLQKLRRI